jgi:hypothetical protein
MGACVWARTVQRGVLAQKEVCTRNAQKQETLVDG